MFSDPQFWVAVAFFLFILAIFNPVRKLLITNLDSQIHDIKNKIEEAENLNKQAQKTLDELKIRENEVEKEIRQLKLNSEEKISELQKLNSKKLLEQIEKRKIVANSKVDQLVRDTNLAIKNHIANIAIETTSYILKNNLNADKKSVLINDSIKELSNVLKN